MRTLGDLAHFEHSLTALLLNEIADFARIGKNDLRAVASHALRNDGWRSTMRPVGAGVGLKAKIELPEHVGITCTGRYTIRVTTVFNSLDLLAWVDLDSFEDEDTDPLASQAADELALMMME